MFAFFIRGFNDTDHMVPVAWRMHADGLPVTVLCLAPDLDLENDYRLGFLRSLGVRVSYAYDDPMLVQGRGTRLVWRVVRTAYRLSRRLNGAGKGCAGRLRQIAVRLSRGLARRIFSRLLPRIANPGSLDGFLRNRGMEVLCFDWVRPAESLVGPLLASAERCGLKTIALPHGVFLCTNDDIAWKADPAQAIGWRNALNDPFDQTVVQYPFFERYLESGAYDRSKAVALGSARYCDEWMARNIALAPRVLPDLAYGDDRLKCVFMPTRLQYKIDVARMRTTFERLAEFDGMRILVKPHTRSSLEAEMYRDLPLEDATPISSVELCQWADVVMVVASSVMIEALHQGKVVLYLKYLHENRTLHEEYGNCWIVESEDELIDALRRLSRDRRDVPYGRANVRKFLTDVVNGGIPDRDVLGDYSRHIRALSPARRAGGATS
jgi:hypothetical protein